MEKKPGCIFTCAVLVPLLQIACSSSNKNELPAMPESFTITRAIAGTDTLPAVEHVNIESLLTAPGNNAIWLQGIVTRNGADLLGIGHRVTTTGAEFDEYVSYDLNDGSIAELAKIDLFGAPVLSSDFSAIAWIDECQGYVQSVNSVASQVHLNPLLRVNSCLRPPRLSGGGETAYFEMARGETGTDGVLRFAGFDTQVFGPVVFHRESQHVTSLAGQDLALEEVQENDLQPQFFGTSISDNGELVASRIGFVPEGVTNIGEIEFDAGILLVNAVTGEYSLIDVHREIRSFCSKCFFYPATDMVISGSGKYVYFLRPENEDLLDATAAVRIFRWDVELEKLDRLPVDDIIDKSSLSVDYTGNHVAYLSDEAPVLLRIDTGERVEMDAAIRNCTGSECEFASFRFIRNNPFHFSGDGSALGIQLIPEKSDVTTSQNTEEAYVLDTLSLLLTRVAAGINAERLKLDSSGEIIAFQTNSAGLIPDDDDLDADIFVIRR